MNKYIQEARSYYNRSLTELEDAEKNGDEARAVDACAKGWLAVVLATDALFVKKGVEEDKLPRGYRGRIYLLKKHGDREVRKIFDSTRNVLHIDGYYERLIDYERIFERLNDVDEYIRTIERL